MFTVKEFNSQIEQKLSELSKKCNFVHRYRGTRDGAKFHMLMKEGSTIESLLITPVVMDDKLCSYCATYLRNPSQPFSSFASIAVIPILGQSNNCLKLVLFHPITNKYFLISLNKKLSRMKFNFFFLGKTKVDSTTTGHAIINSILQIAEILLGKNRTQNNLFSLKNNLKLLREKSITVTTFKHKKDLGEGSKLKSPKFPSTSNSLINS